MLAVIICMFQPEHIISTILSPPRLKRGSIVMEAKSTPARDRHPGHGEDHVVPPTAVICAPRETSRDEAQVQNRALPTVGWSYNRTGVDVSEWREKSVGASLVSQAS